MAGAARMARSAEITATVADDAASIVGQAIGASGGIVTSETRRATSQGKESASNL